VHRTIGFHETHFRVDCGGRRWFFLLRANNFRRRSLLSLTLPRSLSSGDWSLVICIAR
jgi:hypothetical protein